MNNNNPALASAPAARSAALSRLVQFYQTLSPASLQTQLAQHYASDAYFKDPFNEVRGLPAIDAIFQHMYRKLDNPRFVITQTVEQGHDAFLTWDFLLPIGGREQCIRGTSHIRFDSSGLVVWHRDYWDAAEELYEKLPVLGSLMRLLKRASKSG
jgi:hypothetical protein